MRFKFNQIIILFFTLCLTACGTKINIMPEITQEELTDCTIEAEFDGNNTYMQKYLPQNIILKDNAKIKVEYEFVDNFASSNTKYDAVNFINPLVFVGFPLSENNLSLGANLRFFNNKYEIKFSSVCVSSKPRNLFSSANLTELRNVCIPKIQENLKNQINQKFKQGEFNAFR